MLKKLQCQIALYFEENFTGPLDIISTKIREELSIDSSPVILPNNEGAPEEFPVLITNGSSNGIEITLTKKRFDVYIPFETFDPKGIESIIKSFISMGSKINKVGIVLTCIREDASKELVKEQFKDLDKNVEDVYLRFKINKELDDLKVTLFDTYSNGKVENKLDGKKSEGLILVRDYVYETKDINGDMFSKLYAEILKDSETVVF